MALVRAKAPPLPEAPPLTEATAPLGLLGGTFDPIHYGHLRLAEEAREALGLGAVRLIPAGQPPHRGEPGSAAADRLAMAQLAAAGNPALEVDAGEVLAAQKSYTVTTLNRLRAELGAQRPLVLILGADAFAGLPTWHRWEELFGLAHIAVANRPGYDGVAAGPAGRAAAAPEHADDALPALPPALAAACSGRLVTDPAALRRTPAGSVIPFTMTPLAISASLIRAHIGAGRSVRYLLPAEVVDYIAAHALYR